MGVRVVHFHIVVLTLMQTLNQTLLMLSHVRTCVDGELYESFLVLFHSQFHFVDEGDVPSVEGPSDYHTG